MFGNIRPGKPSASNQWNVDYSTNIVDASRHPRVYDYAFASERWSASTLTRYVGMWNAGYERFGDEFEAALATRTEKTQKPTELAKTLVDNLPDPWMLIGRRFEEFTPDEQYWWSRCLSKNYEDFMFLILRSSVPADRALAEWPKYKLRHGGFFAKSDNPESWAKAVHTTVMERYGRTTVSTISREPLLEAITVTDLMSIIEAGVTPQQYADAVKGRSWTPQGLRLYLTEGMPMEYALSL